MLGITCQVVRGFQTFPPCLEHVRAGGGGSVENVGFMLHDSVMDYSLYYILYYLYGVSDGRRVVMVKHEPT